MRFAVYVVLLLLAVGAALSGKLWVALVLAGAKAVLVASEYMELRHAARAHAVVFTLCVGVLVMGLVALSST